MDDDRKEPPMKPSLTYTYKQIENTIINLDVFLSSKRYGAQNISSPVILFIHGGAWIGGNRQEFSRPVFEEFLSHGFVVVSTDYRLVPESSFINGQLEDIRDVETWIKTEMPSKLKDHGFDVQTEQIVVVGGSAGALLALLTTLENQTFRHPRNLRTNKYASAASSYNYHRPTSNSGNPLSELGNIGRNHRLQLPAFKHTETDISCRMAEPPHQNGHAGGATKEEIDQISPLQLCEKIEYPPVYQYTGAQDGLFETYHVKDFAAALEKQDIPHKEHIVT
ncbi:alpha/beta-hydrolase [Aureobasidium pullulans]|uniref:Alpha/beta-hydrolase n=1 Tax=Aureobasidium pullulans TaxID=5580 RepID=A0A4S9LB14_AURPU|nr:alpha/beta-hydrolase [Aureobasidium pullulans]